MQNEILTFQLANNTGDYHIPKGEKLQSEQVFDEILTVNEYNPGFNYKGVWDNQHKDTHPPFYYMIIHTVCSFLPRTFSRWICWSVNIFFSVMTGVFVILGVKQFTEDEMIAIIAGLLFAVNPAFVEMNTFFRMYVMAQFFCTLLIWLHIRYWNDFRKPFWGGCFFTVWAGILTHYYFIVFCFFCGRIYFHTSTVE